MAAATAKGLSLVIPGVQDPVEFFHVTRWNPGLLVGSPGTWTALARFHAWAVAGICVVADTIVRTVKLGVTITNAVLDRIRRWCSAI